MNELENLERLLDRLLREIQNILISGEELSDDFMKMIAEEIGATHERIEELRVQQEPEEDLTAEPVPQDANLLWILSGGDTQAFVNYLRTFPGENFQSYLSNPNSLAALIQRLQQGNRIPPPGVDPDGIPNTLLQSSNVKGMKYDPRTQKLLVKFHGGRGGNSVYQYDSVPAQIFQLLQHGNAFAKTNGQNRYGRWWRMKNPSLGASVNQYLKAGGYAYRRIR